MHQGLYSAVVRSMQHYERLQSHGEATASGKLQVSGSEVSCALHSLVHTKVGICDKSATSNSEATHISCFDVKGHGGGTAQSCIWHIT